MARKVTTFADKVKREKHVVICPICGGPIQTILYVKSEKSSTGSCKFRGKNVPVCKCNQAEVYK
jgi:translation initiation factor 2 beta subunit (eIF-2beta)/eIF-5